MSHETPEAPEDLRRGLALMIRAIDSLAGAVKALNRPAQPRPDDSREITEKVDQCRATVEAARGLIDRPPASG